VLPTVWLSAVVLFSLAGLRQCVSLLLAIALLVEMFHHDTCQD
jgi:hypothetical protein